MITVDRDPMSYAVVADTPRFDLQTYNELGLDLTRLENPDEQALVPRLRMSALAYHVAAQKRAITMELQKALVASEHSVRREIVKAREGFERGIHGITEDHPAIQGWRERNPEMRLHNIHHLDWGLAVGLVRPVDPQKDPEWMREKPFTPVTPGGGRPYYTSPLEVADQLIVARIGVFFAGI
ncbi:hypothetical protein HYW35_02060 [Candidatus Saccharibacteria bacterium]|nr:hypothetical protein [Candidatus Saccharibacteria bacterium]